MPDTTTAKFLFTQPQVGASDDTWGAKLNDNWEAVDALIFSRFPFATPTNLGEYGYKTVGSIKYTADVTTAAPSAIVQLRNASDVETGRFVMRETAAPTGNDVLRAKDLVNIIHPVGSTIIEITGVNPGTRFTGTTWVATATGKAIFGVGAYSGVTWAVNDVKGAATVTLALANLPSHTHDPGTLTTNTVAAHGHTAAAAPGGVDWVLDFRSFENGTVPSVFPMQGVSKSAGTGMQSFDTIATPAPFYASERIVYIAGHGHAITVDANGAHGHAVNGGITGAAGSGTPFSIQSPGQAFYVWLRTA